RLARTRPPHHRRHQPARLPGRPGLHPGDRGELRRRERARGRRECRARPPPAARAWPRGMMPSARSVLGVALLIVLAVAAAGADWLAPYDPAAQDLAANLAPPDGAHPLGRDKLGRDILSRVMYGTRVSLAVGVVTVAVALTIGLLVGGIAGWAGGWLDEILMRAVDVLL